MNYIPGKREHPKASAIPYDDQQLIIRRQDNRCFYCTTSLSGHRIVFDHLYPRSKGGPHGLLNRVASCVTCDEVKKNRYPTRVEVSRLQRQIENSQS